MNKNYAIIKDNKVINCIILPLENVEELLNSVLETYQADGYVEITGENSKIGLHWFYENGKYFPPKIFNSWIWNSDMDNWTPPTEQPGTNYIWDEESVSWILDPRFAEQ